MGLQLSLLSATDFALFVILAIISATWREKEAKKFRIYFLLMAFSYFIAGAFETGGIAGVFSGSSIHPLVALFSALIFCFFASDICGAKKLKIISLIFAALALFLSPSVAVIRAEYLVSVLVGFVSFFMLFEFSHGSAKHAGLLGIIATTAGALVIFAGIPDVTFEKFWFVPNAFLAAGYARLIGFGGTTSRFFLPRKIEVEIEEKKVSIFRVAKPLFYLIVYLSLLNVVLMLGTLALHEAGHLWVGSRLSCTGEAVLFSSSGIGPHTSLSCPEGVSDNALALGGFIFVIPFAAIFFLLREYPERNFGLVILGLGLVMGSLDFSAIILSASFAYLFMFAGALLICLGEALLINEYISPHKLSRH